MSEPKPPLNAITVATQLAQELDARRQEYALGGAIALGYWGTPRGTIDVDVTLFLPPEQANECVWLLKDIGCHLESERTSASFREHGFCRVAFAGLDLDVFLPTVPFYQAAFQRRKRVALGEHTISIWDAESLAVFKMMFFRRKDLADVEQILRTQGETFDRAWVRQQLQSMYGARDPRLSNWDELVRETPAT